MSIDTKRLAEWWCLLNDWQWPKELIDSKTGKVSEPPSHEKIRGAFAVVNALVGKDGLRLWQERAENNLNPATGEALEPQ